MSDRKSGSTPKRDLNDTKSQYNKNQFSKKDQISEDIGPKNENKKICESLSKGFKCKFGSNCRFSHVLPHNTGNRPVNSLSASSQSMKNGDQSKPCIGFLRGNCSYGSSRKFLHEQGHGQRRNPSVVSSNVNRHAKGDNGGNQRGANHQQQILNTSVASQHIAKFWLEVHKNVTANIENGKKSFDMSHDGDRVLWSQCWKAAAAGASSPNPGAHISLLKCYCNLANLAKTHPSANCVVRVLQIVVEMLDKKDKQALPAAKSQQAHTDNLINALTCIVDVVRERLSTPESLQTLNDPLTAELCIKDVRQRFVKLVGMVVDDRNETLFSRITDFSTYLTMVKEWCATHPLGADGRVGEAADYAEQQVEPWLGWRSKPTVGWLMSEGPASWHHVPNMKNLYDSEIEYAETLLRVWTLLTFYWGSGALWPRCSCRLSAGTDEAKTCGEPLLATCSDSRMTCSSIVSRQGEKSKCGKAAAWRCHKMGRDHIALCTTCVRKQQDQLCGAGGPNSFASTDIYDAVVDREATRRDGVVFYLSALKSRRPPRIDPNWKTSYRLTSSSMVAVVRLSASNEPLTRIHSLQWAEIANYTLSSGPGGFSGTPEFQQREQGKIAVKLLSRGDCASLPSDADSPLESGSRVAIIDLRVFVPEVISVLATFANPRFTEQLRQIPFMGRLVGSEKSLLPIVMPHASITDFVWKAIRDSEIECVAMLPEAVKADVARRIISLPPVQSLYGTQLEAFANSLYSSIHCTQGPPGTGKSYVGVCLVLALMVIRKAVRDQGRHVGPILMLSYKNHALDEFLVDVLRFAPDLKPKNGVPRLIRSGKSDHPELRDFGERNSPDERKCQEQLVARIATQHSARKVTKLWLEVSRALNNQSRWSSLNDGDKQTSEFHNQVGSLFSSLRLLVQIFRDRNDIEGGGAAAAHSLLESLVKDSESQSFHEVLQEWILETEHWVRLPSNTVTAHMNSEGRHSLELCWLDAWLRGMMPPPRCACNAVEGQGNHCKHIASANSPFCVSTHCCQSTMLPICREIRVSDKDVGFCGGHRCCAPAVRTVTTNGKERVVWCAKERLGTQSTFCDTHTCSGCLMSDNVPGGSTRMKQGRYACALHQCAETGCDMLQLLPHSYCEDHCCMSCVESGQNLRQPRVKNANTLHCRNHKCGVDGCRERRTGSGAVGLFCLQHTCRTCDSPIDTTVANCLFCAVHRCAHSDCLRPRVRCELNNAFCTTHSCKQCLVLNIPTSGLVTDTPPRNVCTSHPLCQFVTKKGAVCGDLSVLKGVYCATHKVIKPAASEKPISYAIKLISDGRCCGVTKKGNRCIKNISQVADQYFCRDHCKQEPAVVNSVELTPVTTVEVFEELSGVLEKDVDDEDGQDDADSDRDSDDEFVDAVDSKADFADIGGGGDKYIEPNTVLFKVVYCSGNGDLKCGVGCTASGVVPLLQVNWSCSCHSLPARPRIIFKDAVATFAANDVATESQQKGNSTVNGVVVPTELTTKTVVRKVAAIATTVAQPLDGNESDDDYDIVQDTHIVHALEAVGARFLDADEMDVETEATAVETVEDGDDDLLVTGDDDFDNDEVLRRRQLGAVDDDSEGDFQSVDSDRENHSDDDEEADLKAAAQHLLESWSWSMPHHVRQMAASKFLRCMNHLLHEVRLAAEDHVMAARRDRAQASAAALKSAKVVGATVVGASRRLEAIRAAEPFAVVVEEACEVMEPTLISVLAVSSLRKLELVGDHRQLPAAIQQYWYNLETALPSIKTSLFERLITGTVNARVNRRHGVGAPVVAEQLSCTILDEQRRMRASIADITRQDYSDIVDITDHPLTKTQRIGDVFLRSFKHDRHQVKAVQSLQQYQAAWTSNGRHVPGLRSNIFFWDLAGHKESRPEKGLSACNKMEAAAVCALVKHLMLCGVPAGSIAVITPYKGQKNLIISTLRADKCLVPYRKENPPPAGTVVTVSTVDTYQGDENDIVILSLVRARPGNRFVALLNRFIVGVSRARLGFYIVGSVKAVVESQDPHKEGPTHWNRLIADLRGTMRDADETNGFTGQRVGSELPLCCPVHAEPQSYCQASSPTGFPDAKTWNKFCKIVCTSKISCGHQCGLTCHSPNLIGHTTDCLRKVQRPCAKHYAVPLICHDVKRAPDELVDTALNHFACEVDTQYWRPECEHSVVVQCYEHDLLESKTKVLAHPCKEPVEDYHHPVCGHVTKKPQCHVKRGYSTNPPLCPVPVKYERPCGCIKGISCAESNNERANPPLCKTDKTVARPRCGHKISLACHVEASLKILWTAQRGICATHVAANQPLVVTHGEQYGPAEKQLIGTPSCNVPVRFLGKCGHFHNIPCEKAFQCAADTSGSQSSRCDALVKVPCPFCLHCELSVPCWSAPQIAELHVWRGVSPQYMPHSVGSSVQIFESGVAHAGVTVLSPELTHVLVGLCKSRLTLMRSCNESHFLDTDCQQLTKVLTHPGVNFPACVVPVDRDLVCGHKTRVQCCKKEDTPAPFCRVVNNTQFTFPCAEHSTVPKLCVDLQTLRASAQLCKSDIRCSLPRCGHQTTVLCHKAATVTTGTRNGMNVTSEVMVAESKTHQALVKFNEVYSTHPPDAPVCSSLVSFLRECGHVQNNVRCETAFSWAAGSVDSTNCAKKVVIESPLCGHRIETFCWAVSVINNDWQPWAAHHGEVPILGKEYDSAAVTEEDQERLVVSSNRPSPRSLPPRIRLQHVTCNKRVTLLYGACNHSKDILCTEAFTNNAEMRCTEQQAYECPKADCKRQRSFQCHEFNTLSALPCDNIVPKQCSVCHINEVHTQCSTMYVECGIAAKVTLKCGHETSFLCNRDPDPRNPVANILCRDCTVPQWQEYITRPLVDADRDMFAQQSSEHAMRTAIPAEYDVVSMLKVEPNLDVHLEARRRNYQKFVDHMRIEMTAPVLPVPPSLASEEYCTSSYDLVFLTEQDMFKHKGLSADSEAAAAIVSKFSLPEKTQFGTGVKVKLLTKQNLHSVFDDKAVDGAMRIYVGFAHHTQILRDAPLFTTSLTNKAVQQANQVANLFAQKGYSCVAVTNPAHVEERVYWTTGAVIPLAIVSLKLPEQCLICCDQFVKADGCRCVKGHFLCWANCFEGYVTSAAQAGAIQGFRDVDGNLLCPDPKCKHPYDLQNVATQGAPKYIFDRLNKMKTDVETEKRVKEALRVEEDKRRAEEARIAAIADKNERDAHILRLKIVDEILCLRCPRVGCRRVFLDFEGCFALTCSCGCGFCAWCLQDCGGDAHAHVAICAENTNPDVFGTRDTFNAHHVLRRQNAIEELLRDKHVVVRRILVEIMERDLSDLGIRLQPVASPPRAVPARAPAAAFNWW